MHLTSTRLLLLVGLALLVGCATAGPPADPPRTEEPASHEAPPVPPGEPLSGAASAELGKAAPLAVLLPMLLERNPAIRAARARWGAQIEQVVLAGSLPDPKLGYGYFLESVETRVGPQRQRVTLTQPLPFPYKLKLASDSAAEGARAEGLAYQITVRDQVVALKDAYFENWYLERARATSRGHSELLEQLLATARTEQAKGAVTLTDLLRLKSQKAQLEYDLLTLAEQRRVVRARINALIDRSASGGLGVATELAPPIEVRQDADALVSIGLKHRQEIARARVMLKQAGIDLSQARWARVPNVSIGGAWTDIGPSVGGGPESGKDAWMITFGIDLPIWGSKNSARIRKAEALETARREQVREEERTLEASLEKLLFRLRNARRLVELYGKTLLPQAEQAARLAREWYEGGQGGFMHLIEVQSVTYNYHLALDRARADYHQALNRIEGLLGVSLRGAGR